MSETMMTISYKEKRTSLPSPSNDREGLKDFEAASNCFVEKWSPLNYVDLDTPLDNTSIDVDLTKDDIDSFDTIRDIEKLAIKAQSLCRSPSFDTNRDIQQLAIKVQSLCRSPKAGGSGKTIVSAPEKKYVFQDKENFEGKKSLGSKKKKKGKGDSFGTNRNIQQLSIEAQSLHRSPAKVGGKTRVSVQEKKYVFQDKENFEGKRSLDSKKKKKVDPQLTSDFVAPSNVPTLATKSLRQKLTQSEKRVEGLKDVLKQRDTQLLESQSLVSRKDNELQEMSTFVSTLQGLLQGMASGEHANEPIGLAPKPSAVVDELVGMANVCSSENSDDPHGNSALGVTLKESEREINRMKGRITELLDTLASQGSLVDSLKSLSMDSEQTISLLTQLIDEKDKALAEISQFNAMNDCANKKILVHTHQKHRDAMRLTQIMHVNDITSLEEKNIQLLESLSNQGNLIDSLKCLNMDSVQTIASLTQLLGEKDKALAECSQFSNLNDSANRRIMAHANEKHEEDMKNLHHMLSLQLRERYNRQRELTLIKLQIEDEREMDNQYVAEVKFVLAFLLVCHLVVLYRFVTC